MGLVTQTDEPLSPLALKIEMREENPKEAGSKAHEKYEKYKKARTKEEYLSLEGTLGDYKIDLSKSFVKEISAN